MVIMFQSWEAAIQNTNHTNQMSGLNPEVAENSVGTGDTLVDCSLAIGGQIARIYTNFKT